MPDVANKYRCFLLDDSPAAEDAFGSHKRIAEAINAMVRSEPGGKAVALVGRWGSGKSTVVNFLKPETPTGQADRSEKEGQFAVFVFDTWAHEGDPLRRIFLEQLITFLIDKRWVPQDKWISRLKELSKKQTKTTTISTPILTKWGEAFAVLLYLAVFGLALVRHSAFKTTWLYLGPFLYILPLVVLLFAMRWGGRKGSADRRGDDAGLLLNKVKETKESETFESPEPTSVEFERWFQELVTDSVSAERRLLIVVDNLDRVDVGDAKKLWSSMRTFLDLCGREIPLWATHLWVLIPFDSSGISRLWDANEVGGVAETFLEKTFQIRFEVPSPLLSDWRGFLQGQLKAAFPDHPEDEGYTISRIFAILRRKEEAPTPRDIKLFINQIGAAFRAAPEDIPLPHLALYTMLERTGWKPLQPLPELEQLEPYVGPDWLESVAAVYFNMPKKRVRHVLFGDRVDKALSEADRDQIKALVQYPGVDSVVEDMVDKGLAHWTQNDPQFIGRAAYAIGEADEALSPSLRNACRRLLRGAGRITFWRELDAKGGKGFGSLVSVANDEEFTSSLLKSLGTWSPKTGPKGAVDVESTARWIEGVLEVLAGTQRAGQEELIEKHFRLGKTGDDYLAVAVAVSEMKTWQSYWPFLRPACRREEVIQCLQELGGAGKWNTATDRACRVMLMPDSKWNFDALVNSLRARLPTQQLNVDEGAAIIRTLFRLRGKMPGVESDLRNIMQNGWGFHHLHAAQSQNQPLAVASWLMAAVFFLPEAGLSGGPVNTMSGVSTYRSIAGNPTAYSSVVECLWELTVELSSVSELLAKRYEANTPRKLLETIVVRHAERLDAYSLFSPQLIVESFHKLAETLGADATRRVITVSLEKGNLLPYLLQAGFSLERVALYRIVLAAHDSAELREKLASELRELKKERWLEALEKNDDVINLAFDLLRSNVHLQVSYPLKDAISEIARRALSKRLPAHVDTQFCSVLVSALTVEQLDLLKRELRDTLINSTSSAGIMIGLFTPLVNDCEILSEDADRLVREAFRGMLERLDPTELGWIAQVTAKCPDILKKCPQATRRELVERVRDIAKGVMKEEVKPCILQLARTLGVKIEDSTPEKKP
jgi:hypothetical protein